jgi:hypothetical protein
MDKESARFRTYTQLEKNYQKMLAGRLPRRNFRNVRTPYRHIAHDPEPAMRSI